MGDTYASVAHDAVQALEVVAAMMDDPSEMLVGIVRRIASRLRGLDAHREAGDSDATPPAPAKNAAPKTASAIGSTPKLAPAMEPAPMPVPTMHPASPATANGDEEKPHGRSVGTIPKSVKRAKRLRLVGVDQDCNPTGFVDEGTATELANRNRIAPSTIYRIAGTGKAVNGYVVEKVVG